MFTHIVFFKLKEASEENIQKARKILESMRGQIPELKDIEVGVDVIKSERSFDIALITRFDSREDYQKYAVCDFHVNNVLQFIRPMCECSKTVDYGV
ncbi:stress responsive protein [Clostridium polyendosporum]|uniref:Stress responsive protein n=1 Tax=Clostridium polyendosporum TaxID=69208 RepID=A0A919RZ22_9CLOT|nr:Dabb family protein [Clostridium polyendosporum]GIM28213.1 stress responsive protein [Clostridium polyendosporum]